MARKRKCEDPRHTWDPKQSRCRECRLADDRLFGNSGNRGPTECTVDYAEWCRITGFDPMTGGYTNEPKQTPPAWVETADEGGFNKKMADV